MKDQWTDRLSDYLDGEMDAPTRAAFQAHLSTCDACTTVLAELRQVVARAASLPDAVPPERVWTAIAQRISSADADGQVIDLSSRRPRPGRERRWSFTLPQLAVAALGLIAMSSGGAWLILNRVDDVGPPQVVIEQPDASVHAVSVRATADIEGAVADLEALLAAGREHLSAETVAAIEANLQLVDHAIGEARAALQRDPQSEYLNAYLAESMQRKLSLLRQSTAIIRAST